MITNNIYNFYKYYKHYNYNQYISNMNYLQDIIDFIKYQNIIDNSTPKSCCDLLTYGKIYPFSLKENQHLDMFPCGNVIYDKEQWKKVVKTGGISLAKIDPLKAALGTLTAAKKLKAEADLTTVGAEIYINTLDSMITKATDEIVGYLGFVPTDLDLANCTLDSSGMHYVNSMEDKKAYSKYTLNKYILYSLFVILFIILLILIAGFAPAELLLRLNTSRSIDIKR